MFEQSDGSRRSRSGRPGDRRQRRSWSGSCTRRWRDAPTASGCKRRYPSSRCDRQLQRADRVTLQDLGGFAQDRHGVRTQVRLVEVEVDALQVDGDRHRATVRTDGLTRLRVRALVVAVVDAVTVVVQIGAARGNRAGAGAAATGPGPAGSRRRPKPARHRTSLRSGGNALVVEVSAVSHFGADSNALSKVVCRPTPSLAATLPSRWRGPLAFSAGYSSSDFW